MKVFIRTLTNQKYELEVDPEQTIETLKVLIHQTHNLGEPDSQKLIYSGKILRDEQTLSDAKIREGGFIVLMIKKEIKKADEPAPAPVVQAQAAASPFEAIPPVNAADAQAAADDDHANDEANEEEEEEDDEEHIHLDWPPAGVNLEHMDPAQLNEMVGGLSQLVEQNPELMEQFVQHLSEVNPQLASELASGNNVSEVLARPEVLAEVLNLMSHLGGDEDDEFGGDHVMLEISEEDNAAIARLEALGFPRNLAAEAYFLCDKNEELAANYLFENMYDLDQH